MQANVNLDALLEKMKAELERAKGFEPINFENLEKMESCLHVINREREKLEREIEMLQKEIEDTKNTMQDSSRRVLPLLIIAGITILIGIFYKVHLGESWGLSLFGTLGIVGIIGSIYHAKRAQSFELKYTQLQREKESKRKRLENLANDPIISQKLQKMGLSGELCKKELQKLDIEKEGGWRILSGIVPELENSLNALYDGKFDAAANNFNKAAKNWKK